jgi:hypothetical protein
MSMSGIDHYDRGAVFSITTEDMNPLVLRLQGSGDQPDTLTSSAQCASQYAMSL